MEKHGRLEIEKNFYYYTNNGEFRLNAKTFLQYGLMLCITMIVLSVDTMFTTNSIIPSIIAYGTMINHNSAISLGLITTIILFLLILIIIQRLQKNE